MEVGQKIYFSGAPNEKLEVGDWMLMYVNEKNSSEARFELLGDEVKDGLLDDAVASGVLNFSKFDVCGLFSPPEGEHGFLVQVESVEPVVSVMILAKIE